MDWIFQTLTWYIYTLLLGLAFYPLAKKLLPGFLDKGWGLARIVGAIFLCYALLVLGVVKLVPYTRVAILAIIAIVGYVSWRPYFARRNFIDFISSNAKTFNYALIAEGLFLAGLILWVMVRGEEPSIHGLEKFMDFGFMQSIGRTTYFPPLDMWYSGEATARPDGYFINYYYFGHLTGATLIKLAGVLPAVGYNLVLAHLLGVSLAAAFSITTSLIHLAAPYLARKVSDIKLVFHGILAALLLNFAGNMHLIYLFTRGYPNESPLPPNHKDVGAGLDLIARTIWENKQGSVFDSLSNMSKYWYPNATRFIEHTIHEFPSYSYVVADLHGHVFNIQYVLLFVAFAVASIFVASRFAMAHNSSHDSHPKTPEVLRRLPSHIRSVISFFAEIKAGYTVFLGMLVAVHFMTNAFDGPIYFGLSILVLVAIHGFSFNLIYNVLFLGLFFVWFSFPFSVFFEPFVSGIGVNCGYPLAAKYVKNAGEVLRSGPLLFEKGNCQKSAPYQMFILWGYFWVHFVVMAVIVIASSKLKSLREFLRDMKLPDYIAIAIFAFATILVIVPEFVYIKDIYPTHFRANTLFKLGYQAYILMTLMSVYTLWRLTTLKHIGRYIFIAVSIALSVFVLMYIRFAVVSYYSYYGKFSRGTKLNGQVWLRTDHKDVDEIVNYFNTEVQGQPTILEAQGDSYTDYNVVSAYTGLPTVAGWWVHEWLWRGNANVVGTRIPDIEAMYYESDVSKTRELLHKYRVKYVIVSSLERKKYDKDDKKISEDKFKEIGALVYVSGDGKGRVYKIFK